MDGQPVIEKVERHLEEWQAKVLMLIRGASVFWQGLQQVFPQQVEDLLKIQMSLLQMYPEWVARQMGLGRDLFLNLGFCKKIRFGWSKKPQDTIHAC